MRLVVICLGMLLILAGCGNPPRTVRENGVVTACLSDDAGWLPRADGRCYAEDAP